LQLKDHDYLRLQFLGAKNAWLGCPYDICDLHTCPSNNGKYQHFGTGCIGEEFQIIGEGTTHNPIKSGQRIRLRFVNGYNTWVGCPHNNCCDKRPCSGTTVQGGNFNMCGGEILKIYAHGRKNGEVVYNGDVVMLEHHNKYITIQGEFDGHDTSLNFCPGKAPPAYFSYGICSKNVFHVYRKP